MSTHDIVANPAAGCPPTLVADQRALEVVHVGFDGRERTGVIEVHRAVADDVTGFFDVAHQLRFPIERVVPASELGWDDPRLMAANCSSGFNFRVVAGRTSLSNHAFGLAFDVNTVQNPFVRRHADGTETVEPAGARYDPDAPGTLTDGHPLVAFLLERGWTWGGHWTLDGDGLVDYQHLEKRLEPAERAEWLRRYGLDAGRP